LRAAALRLLCAAVPAAMAASAAERVTIDANGHRILAEVADTPDARDRGLMFRTAMPADHGMLFVYPNDARHCMWMRNTYVPLSVAFLDEHGRVINTDEMVPRTDTSHCAAGPARFVLEMPAGWFLQHGVGGGTRLDFTVAPAPR
jgi:uncharacterized membrane protein (UPF0127 family)